MKTDSLFYRIFQSFPGIFWELIHAEDREAQNYQFASVEVKQTAFRIDGIFLPPENQPEPPIYFVEVQFQKDEVLYERLFAEIFVYLKQTNLENNWQCVVIYPNRKIEQARTARYQVLINSPQVTRIYLEEIEWSINFIGIKALKLITESEKIAAEKAKELIEDTRKEKIEASIKRELVELIETIMIYKYSQYSREEIGKMLGLTSELKETRVYQEAKEEGREEGRAEGREEGKLKAILPMLALGATPEQIASALELEIEKVRQIQQQSQSQH